MKLAFDTSLSKSQEPLKRPAFRGVFEAHITVAADAVPFRLWCEDRGLKAVVIALPRGETPLQPMTSTYHRGALEMVRREVDEVALRLESAGFAVTRRKIEATGSNGGVPQTDAEAALLPKCYFEYHVKLRLPRHDDLEAVKAVAIRHGGHLSRNARRVLREAHGDVQERFVTLRVYGVGKRKADQRWAALEADLRALGHPLSHRLAEYTVLDTNADVDAGWLP